MLASQSAGQQSLSDDCPAVPAADGTDLCVVQVNYEKKDSGVFESPFCGKEQSEDPSSHVLYRTGTVSVCRPECHDERTEKSGRRRCIEKRRTRDSA